MVLFEDSEIDKINLDCLDKDLYRVGNLTNNIISLLGLGIPEKQIIIWKDRIKYIEKHKNDFKSEEDYKKHTEAIPTMIKNPDYAGLHPSDGSIQYIKRIDEIMLVGVRMKERGKFVVRSCYPISQEKLNEYIRCGTVKKVPR